MAIGVADWLSARTSSSSATRTRPATNHAADIEASLVSKAASVEVVDPLEGKDAADHLAAGHRLEDFVAAEKKDPVAPVGDKIDPERRPLSTSSAGSNRFTRHRAVVGQRAGRLAARLQPTTIAAASGAGKTTLVQRLPSAPSASKDRHPARAGRVAHHHQPGCSWLPTGPNRPASACSAWSAPKRPASHRRTAPSLARATTGGRGRQPAAAARHGPLRRGHLRQPDRSRTWPNAWLTIRSGRWSTPPINTSSPTIVTSSSLTMSARSAGRTRTRASPSTTSTAACGCSTATAQSSTSRPARSTSNFTSSRRPTASRPPCASPSARPATWPWVRVTRSWQPWLPPRVRASPPASSPCACSAGKVTESEVERVRRRLKVLEAAGMIETVGHGRTARWVAT